MSDKGIPAMYMQTFGECFSSGIMKFTHHASDYLGLRRLAAAFLACSGISEGF